jgi:hypothetical protein
MALHRFSLKNIVFFQLVLVTCFWSQIADGTIPFITTNLTLKKKFWMEVIIHPLGGETPS